MGYIDIINAAESPTLQRRVTAAVAQEAASAGLSIASMSGWVAEHMLTIAATSGWGEKWAYAVDTYAPQFNPDTGARPDVISDADILTAVQPLVQALVPDESAEPTE